MEDSDHLNRKHYNISTEDLRSWDTTSISSDDTVSDLDKVNSVKTRSSLPVLTKFNPFNRRIDKLKWDCNKCRKKDLEYLDYEDLISSDETVSDLDLTDNSLTKKLPKKFNQLNPTTKFIHKLLKSVKPKTKSIWNIVKVSDGLVDSDNKHSRCDMSIDSYEKMEKSSSKRKRKQHSVDEEELLQSLQKKFKRTSKDIKREFVNRKEQVHSVSSSDSESIRKSPSKSTSSETSLEGSYHKNQQTHLLTSDEDCSRSKLAKSCKIPKSPQKAANVIHIKKEFNHTLSSDEGCNSSINKSPQIFKVPQNSGLQFVKSEIEVDGLSDLDAQIIDTEDSSLEDKQKFQNHIFTTQVKNKSDRKQAISREDEQELTKYSSLLDDRLAEKYNIWIMQCPNSIDCADFVGQSLDLTGEGSARLTVGDTVFEAYSYQDPTRRSATLAVPSCSNQLQMCKIPVTGNIILEESVDIKNKKSFSIPDPPQCVELPQNLKTRHPLLGIDYERKAPTSSFPKSQKSSKKKKRSKSFNENSYSNGVREDDLETTYEESEVKNKKHKKKKKKHYSDESN